MVLCLRALWITEIHLRHIYTYTYIHIYILVCQVSPIKGKYGKEKGISLLPCQIVQCLEKVSKHEIFHKNVSTISVLKRFVSDSEHRWVCADKGIRRKVAADKCSGLNAITKQQTGYKLLVPLEPRESQSVRSSRGLQVYINLLFQPFLTNAHKQKRLQWVQKYMD